MYSTGNSAVDKMQKYVPTAGNYIPLSWHKTITRENGKPYPTAIMILSDIVYWYRPREVRDESTGFVIRAEKKFKADFLQRSYQQLADLFGYSKREVTNAVVALEKLGVIKRHFRNAVINGMTVNNILYIELIPEKLFELTYLKEEQGQLSKVTPITLESDSPHFEKCTPPTLESETNTYNTTKITTDNKEREYRERTQKNETHSLSQNYIDFFKPNQLTQEQMTKQEEYFAKFWNAYPRKSNKFKTRIEWNNIQYDVELYEKILRSVELYKQSQQWRDANYIPYPENYLRNEKWEDDIPITVESEEMPF